MAAPADKKKPTIADVLASSQRKHSVRAGNLNDIAEDVAGISTDNLSLDDLTGVGGLPLGRSVELFGPPSSGKTTTALQTVGKLQQIIIAGGDPSKGITPDDVILYMDYEHALDPAYVLKLGLDVTHPSFVFSQPDTFEDGANFARELISTGLVRAVVWDSVAAMTPSAKLQAETGKSLPAVQAKLMSEFTSALNPLLHENNTISIFVNHIFDVMDMGGRPGMPKRTSTPGGRALKFYASLRISFQPIGFVKTKVHDPITNEEVEIPTATNVKVKVEKNKVGPPLRTAIVRVRYGRGFDNMWSAMQILIAHKYVMYSGGYHYFHKVPDLVTEWMPKQKTGTHRPYIRSEELMFRAADAFPEWRAQVIEKARVVLAEASMAAPDPEDEDDEPKEDTPKTPTVVDFE